MGLMQVLATEPEHPLSSSSTAPGGARTPKPLGRAGACRVCWGQTPRCGSATGSVSARTFITSLMPGRAQRSKG